METESNNYRQQSYTNRRNHQKEYKEYVLTDNLGKLMPQDLEMEEAVLGALMLESEAFSVVCDLLRPEYFYEPAHQKIYAAIQSIGAQNNPIDMLTVTEQLRANHTLEEVGGPVRISELTAKVSSAAHLEYHARVVLQKHIARELITYSSHIQERAFDESFDVYDLLQEAEGGLFKISQNNLKKDVVQIDPIIHQAIEKIQEAANSDKGFSGIESGYYDLDKITSGWQRSDLIIVAARPAMGKTAFVLSMAANMAVNYNTPVAIFSLEMSNLQLVNRLISNVCELNGEKIKSGQLSNIEWQRLLVDVKKLYSSPLYIDDTPSLSVFELRTKAQRLVREKNVSMIIIDYLQLMNATGMKFGSREQEVSTISRSLKQLAKELDIPIIALSQLNRSVENRADGKVPQLSDLRESGAIEQDADIVCFIHRPEYYTKSGEDAEGHDIRGLAQFIIAKHRSGKTDTVKMRFRKDFARFENWDEGFNLTSQVVESRLNDDNVAAPAPAPINIPNPDMPDYISESQLQNDTFLSQRDENDNVFL